MAAPAPNGDDYRYFDDPGQDYDINLPAELIERKPTDPSTIPADEVDRPGAPTAVPNQED
jgi:hypothetical protein